MAIDQADSVPITVVSGPLGAGKTTLVNRLLSNPGDRRIAVVVNDMGEVNVDAELLAEETGEGIVDLSNGCICCRLQDDLVTEVTRLAEERSFDYLVVEASGISEPIPIARTLSVGTDEATLPEKFRLDTTVSVVDAYGFWKAFDADESLPDAAPDPERPLTEVLVDQIEFCDVLLLNKCDMVPDDELDAVEAAIRELQPRATLYRTTYSEVDPSAVLGTGLFDFESARREQGWKRALAEDGHAGGHDESGHESHGHGHDRDGQSAAAAHGVESFVYRRERPFHAERFDAWLDDWDGSVVRAKGFAWVASRPETVLGVSQAGPSVQAGPIGEWGEDDPATRLVFIGREMDEAGIAAGLDDCLATDAERAAGAEGEGAAADDPFPREG
ncbi:CobW family GTP-binding protein [Haloarcula nitratireducens]|uniref:GTP-binding protein n=1 Tax=Haloarcula nitratireducens TaxID=2487749 RepID=A0AAW4P7B5_9EURY|nr:GTP-binding protein [Halomicroarcula nitratireducens]MBX0293643.1 GTP-binding protein [Halomicroarcula nitratireducens]